VGNAGRLRPHRSVCDEEAQLTPLGKRASWSGNQLTHTEIATMYTKTANNIKVFKKLIFISNSGDSVLQPVFKYRTINRIGLTTN
jgi:hypothetical protein